jgi:hypothetical protein
MNLITQTITAACFAVLISEASGIIAWIKYYTGIRRLKPFDCPMCLAFWLSFILCLLHGEIVNAPLLASFSAILAILLSKAVSGL